ncbi:MAG TPA: RDD family protein [Acidimicrobiales bacterium]|nr:RDD family protein [Acidimicrobiales bacterium]
MAEYSSMPPPPPPGGGPSGPRAGFGERFAGWLIDSIIMGVVAFILYEILGAVGQALGLLLFFGYIVYFQGSSSGQTPGMKVMNIRVIDFATGGPIDRGRAALRGVGYLVSGFVCYLGYLWMLWDPEKQCWQDKIANTVVVPTSAYPVAAWPG